MKVYGIQQNYQNKPSFGTKIGSKLQVKIEHAIKSGSLSPEHNINLQKIKDDGLDVILDIHEKYLGKNINGKNTLDKINFLTVIKNGDEKSDIANLNQLGFMTLNGMTERVFIHKFVRIFNDEFNLAGKISKAAKKDF